MKRIICLTFLFLILVLHGVYAQCPPNVDVSEIIINTQEEYDKYVVNYPDCGWHIVKVNNKFIGDPRPLEYLLVLIGILGASLVILKFLFSRFTIKVGS